MAAHRSIAGCVVGALFVLAGCQVSRNLAHITAAVQDLREDLARTLPEGANVAEAIAWLDTRDIAHSTLVSSGGRRRIHAIVRDVDHTLLERTDITIVFEVDAADRITSVQVDQARTGL